MDLLEKILAVLGAVGTTLWAVGFVFRLFGIELFPGEGEEQESLSVGSFVNQGNGNQQIVIGSLTQREERPLKDAHLRAVERVEVLAGELSVSKSRVVELEGTLAEQKAKLDELQLKYDEAHNRAGTWELKYHNECSSAASPKQEKVKKLHERIQFLENKNDELFGMVKTRDRLLAALKAKESEPQAVAYVPPVTFVEEATPVEEKTSEADESAWKEQWESSEPFGAFANKEMFYELAPFCTVSPDMKDNPKFEGMRFVLDLYAKTLWMNAVIYFSCGTEGRLIDCDNPPHSVKRWDISNAHCTQKAELSSIPVRVVLEVLPYDNEGRHWQNLLKVVDIKKM